MGGFVLCNKDGQPTKTLSFPHFKRLVHENVIDFPHLTSLEIQERSNLHPAFAFIALLQATWFIAQCLSRVINAGQSVQSLVVITQLEGITAPLVIVNWCIFLFTWKKPLDAQRPILIKSKVNLPSLSDRDPQSTGTLVTEAFEREQNTFQSIERRFQLECPQSQSTFSFKSIFRLRLTRGTVTSTLLWPVRSICEDLRQSLPFPTCASHEFLDGTLKIPLFYVHTTMQHVPSLLLVSALGTGVSIVSILFLLPSGSTLPFTSESAKHVWRIASITSTSFNALTLGSAILANFLYFIDGLPVFFKDQGVLILYLCVGNLIIGFLPFLLASVVLLVSSIICLRSVPGDVLVGQSWVDYIPHFSL